MKSQIADLRIHSVQIIPTPAEIKSEFPITESGSFTIYQTRENIKKILKHQDDRLLVVVGPCSIHDVDAAREYAFKLKEQILKFADKLCIVMRVYFEKPRTTIGWKGLIKDPYIDGSSKIDQGLRLARKLLVDLAELGVPAGSEFVDLITPQYTAELVSWGAIGARTTESQIHRELTSGLSCAVGFKNGTQGSLQIAIDAICAAAHPHYFLSHTTEGRSAIFETKGNQDCHIILRGGRIPNYLPEHVTEATHSLEKAKLLPSIMIDCSHANSNKDYTKQSEVCRSIAQQITNGNFNIIGVMIESHLAAGKQQVIPGKALHYGQSITDACIDWDNTVVLLEELAEAVTFRRKGKTLEIPKSFNKITAHI